jgi:hypothetical protein
MAIAVENARLAQAALRDLPQVSHSEPDDGSAAAHCTITGHTVRWVAPGRYTCTDTRCPWPDKEEQAAALDADREDDPS